MRAASHPPDLEAPGAGLPLVETLAEDHRWDALGLPDLAARAAAATLRRLRLDPAAYEVSVLGCNDARIAELNADFRGKPQPTNVLSWPSADRAAPRAGAMPRRPAATPAAPLALGDIALAWETCAREAEAEGRPLADHAAHLLVHGLLHLLGFDHDRDADAALMERLETEVMADLDLPDPYAPGASGDPGARVG